MTNYKKDVIFIIIFSLLFLAFMALFTKCLPAPIFTSATLRGIYELSPDGPYQVLYEYRGQVQERIFKTHFEADAFGDSLAAEKVDAADSRAR